MSFLFAFKMIYWVEPDMFEGVIAINIHVTKTLMFEQLHVNSSFDISISITLAIKYTQLSVA